MEYQDFSNILESIVVPLTESIDIEKYQRVLEYISLNKPDSLYRYRSCNERNYEAFYKDQVWVSTPDCMNDGFDTRLYFDKNRAEKTLDEWIEKELSNQIRDVVNDNREIPEDMSDLLAILDAKTFLGSLSKEQLECSIKDYVDVVKRELSSLFSVLPYTPQQAVRFACFSEDITSAVMWGVYGADESGFALEYGFPQVSFSGNVDEINHRSCMLYPVIYSDKRYEVPIEYIQFLLNYRMWFYVFSIAQGIRKLREVSKRVLQSLVCPDLFVPTKIALYKSIEWKHEKEWRVFCSSSNDYSFNNAKHGYYCQKPKGVYLGRRISPISEKILKDLAKEKGVPVYKMDLDDDNRTYKLTYRQCY